MNSTTEKFCTVVLICIICIFIGFIVGAKAMGESWRDDCDKVGRNVSMDKVYICYPESK